MTTYEIKPGISLDVTPLLVGDDGGAKQVCRLTVKEWPQAEDGVVTVRRAGEEFGFPVALPAGESEHELLVPEAAETCQGVVGLEVGEERHRVEVGFGPVRRWRVFLVNHSHTDIGFTHTVSDVVEVHNKNLERALELAAATADWPEEARFRWTCESAWQVQNFLRDRPGARQRLAAAVRAGEVEIEALYIHSYFDLLSREQLVRELYLAQELRETLGVPITSAMICDVPGCAWSLVDPLAASGVRYLGMAPNNFLAPFHEITELPRPFVWEGPAGGRVLVWYTDDPYWAYIEGARHGFWTGLAEVERRLPAKLSELEADGYGLDVLQIQTGSDNRPLRLLPSIIARDWNAKYLSPKLRVATSSEFFREVEAGWADRLPVVRGEWQSSWSQTTMHYPVEAAASRRNHATLDAWERFAVVADWLDEAYRYPGSELAATYDASLLFDEHSGPKGIWRPRSEEQANEALRQGYEIFERATAPARAGLDGALEAATGVLAGGDEPGIVVWNPLGWRRGGVVEVELPAEWVDESTAVVDEVSSQPVAFEVGEAVDGRVRCRVQVEDVPAVGFKRLRLSRLVSGERVDRGLTARADRDSLSEAQAVRVERGRLALVVEATGTITSLVDTRSGREFVELGQWAGLNALVRYLPERHGPEPGGSFTDQTGLYVGTPVEGRVLDAAPAEAEELEVEEAFDRVVVRARAVVGDYRREVEIRLDEDGWVDVRNRLTWLRRPENPELVYLVFPFALREPEIRQAAQYAIVDPRRQTLSGSSLDAFAVQHWLDVSAAGAGVTVHSRDLPLVEYGGIHLQRFLRRLEVETGILAFRVGAGRALPPAERDPFGQGACVEARFALRPYLGDFDPAVATRFGEERALPLQARPLPAGNPGGWREPALGFVEVESPTAMLTGLKRGERADGLAMRVWESAGRRTTVRIAFPQHELLTAWRMTPAEGEIGRMAVVDDGVELELGPFELAALRVVVGR